MPVQSASDLGSRRLPIAADLIAQHSPGAPAAARPRAVVELPGPAPTLYGIGFVARARIEDLVGVLPGGWGELASIQGRARVLEPMLRGVGPQIRSQVNQALTTSNPAASLQALLGKEFFSAGVFAVVPAPALHGAAARRDPGALPPPSLFVTYAGPGVPGTIAAVNAWDPDRRFVQAGIGRPVRFSVPWSQTPAVLMRNAYGGAVVDPRSGAGQVRANLLLGTLLPVPFGERVTKAVAGALKTSALAVQAGNVVGIGAQAVATRGASTRWAGFQMLVAQTIATGLRTGGAVVDRSTLYGGPAWHASVSASGEGLSALLQGERWQPGEVVVKVAGRSFPVGDPAALGRALQQRVGGSAEQQRAQRPANGGDPARAAANTLDALRAGVSPYALAIAQARAGAGAGKPYAAGLRNGGIPALAVANAQVELAAKLGLQDSAAALAARTAGRSAAPRPDRAADWADTYVAALPAPVRTHLQRKYPALMRAADHGTASPGLHRMLTDIHRQGGPRNATQAGLVGAIAQGFMEAHRQSGRDVLGDWVRGAAARGGRTASLPVAAAHEAAEPRGQDALEPWLKARFGSNGLGLNFGWTRVDGAPLIESKATTAPPPGVTQDPASWRAENRAWLQR
jgi:hypothetical protein